MHPESSEGKKVLLSPNCISWKVRAAEGIFDGKKLLYWEWKTGWPHVWAISSAGNMNYQLHMAQTWAADWVHFLGQLPLGLALLISHLRFEKQPNKVPWGRPKYLLTDLRKCHDATLLPYTLEQLLSLMLESHLPKGIPSQTVQLCQPQKDVYCVLSAPNRTFVVCGFSVVPFSWLWVYKTLGGKDRLLTGPAFTHQSSRKEKETHLSVLLSLAYFWTADDSDHSLLWWGCLNSKYEYVRAHLPPVTSVKILYQVLNFSAQVSMLKSMKQQITHFWDVWRENGTSAHLKEAVQAHAQEKGWGHWRVNTYQLEYYFWSALCEDTDFPSISATFSCLHISMASHKSLLMSVITDAFTKPIYPNTAWKTGH